MCFNDKLVKNKLLQNNYIKLIAHIKETDCYKNFIWAKYIRGSYFDEICEN